VFCKRHLRASQEESGKAAAQGQAGQEGGG
jgi:hypothetical protein